MDRMLGKEMGQLPRLQGFSFCNSSLLIPQVVSAPDTTNRCLTSFSLYARVSSAYVSSPFPVTAKVAQYTSPASSEDPPTLGPTLGSAVVQLALASVAQPFDVFFR